MSSRSLKKRENSNYDVKIHLKNKNKNMTEFSSALSAHFAKQPLDKELIKKALP